MMCHLICLQCLNKCIFLTSSHLINLLETYLLCSNFIAGFLTDKILFNANANNHFLNRLFDIDAHATPEF